MELEPIKTSPSTRIVTFWLYIWLGTLLAGGLFGAMLGVLPLLDGEVLDSLVGGLIVGPFVAAEFATPIISSIAVLTWAFWLYRYRVLMAVLGGGATGILATIKLFRFFPQSMFLLCVVACLFGTVGAGIAVLLHKRWMRSRDTSASGAENQVWQFTLADLFARMTVLAVLFPIWIWLVGVACK